MTKSNATSKFRTLFRREEGNFAMLAALTVPVLFMAGSLAVDTTNALSMKVRLQNAVDSAALATAMRLTEEEDLTQAAAKAFALKFLNGQVQEDLPGFQDMAVSPNVTITPVEDNGRTIWKVAIALGGSYTLTPMARVLGQEKMTVNVVGKSESAGEAQGSFSMALVLDRSGSMGWNLNGQQKIAVLKTAVGGLVDQFKVADPNKKYVRLGASSYQSYMTGSQSLVWNPEKTRTFVNALPASGGTDSTAAFKWGYDALKHKRENNQHNKKSGQVPKKFIVFMTDGENNYSSADSSTKIHCDNAKKDGIEVYSVAFAAPAAGKALLSYCATSSDHFYDAQNSAQLIEAFKNIGNAASKVVSRLTE
ncbi:TadE/TadG family type IV pilus assembly protein [uncultured Hoeflea sp.]|uniref:vWA domain-containing protein n=1 Tax=uncultured Hoeflea sp. TaxID=538666 RepID=UPI002631F4F2|nr:TadE/TadG family type IV pilus assembly protein [uncultured Hoeflea sp.]